MDVQINSKNNKGLGMKLCSVIVWYNPDLDCINNILSYSAFVEKCYIIDNSVNDNSNYASKIPNSIYIPNLTNCGIAKALNIGCQKALDDGFEWCMTMDQDSIWEENQIKNYLNSIKNSINSDFVSYGPNLKLTNKISVLSSVKRKIFGINKRVKSYDYTETPNKIITSGNIIKLTVWKEVNCFYEPFFIDEVDNEFCFKLKKNGYNIRLFKDIFLTQTIGNSNRNFFPGETHSSIRLYYMMRNRLYMQKMYPDLAKKEDYRYWISKLIQQVLLKFSITSTKYMVKGFNDFKKGILGEFKK